MSKPTRKKPLDAPFSDAEWEELMSADFFREMFDAFKQARKIKPEAKRIRVLTRLMQQANERERKRRSN